MKKIIFALFALVCVFRASAQNELLEGPALEYVMELKVTIDGAYGVGETTHGNRFIIPITGGTFEGPKIKGTVIPGGADYQMIDTAKGRTELEAIYSIRTDDGVNIHVRNCGILYDGPDENGQRVYYFRTAPKFEAPKDSKYDWLNNAIFVCVPNPLPEYISLKVWRVL